MQIYISGQITGLELETAQQNFIEAAELLSCLGIDPVNPFENGLTQQHSWEQHMIRDIEMLLTCDGVFMLNNWTKSRGAKIEHAIAVETGKILMYESLINERMRTVQAIREAILEVTGLRLEDYSDEKKDMKRYFARLIFAHQCRKNGVSMHYAAEMLHRYYKNMGRYQSNYENEYLVNREFRLMADKVNIILANKVLL